MAIFGKKKEDKTHPILEQQKMIRKLLQEEAAKTGGSIEEAGTHELDLYSKEYAEFKKTQEGEKELKTFFEKACKLSGKIFQINIGEKSAVKAQETLDYIEYKIEAKEVVSFGLAAFLLWSIAGFAYMFISFNMALMMMLLGLASFVMIQKYPNFVSSDRTMKVMNSMPLAITYLVIFLRNTPTLEGAVMFAGKHLRGPLGRDLNGLVWQLESGTYSSMDEALKEYSEKWQSKNKNFSTSIEIIRGSLNIANEKERLETLDQASNIMLEGNLEMMKDFARGMTMPVIVLYMLAIVLPVMGLVLAPIMTTLLSGGMKTRTLFVSYDIVLPIIVFFFMTMVLSKRPGTFSHTSVDTIPGMPKKGHYAIVRNGKVTQIPLIYVSIAAALIVGFPGIMQIFSLPESYSFMNIIQSMTLIWGIALGIIIYTIGSSRQKLAARMELETLEDELDVALYDLSDRLNMGNPIEHAIGEAERSLKKGPLKKFFRKINDNMVVMGMPFEKAVFNKEEGALVYFPSDLIRTVMEIVVEGTKKGLHATSSTMRTISKYLKNMKIVKSNIKELLGTTVSSMKFQSQFLTSFIAGIIVSLDILLTRILGELSTKVGSFQGSESAAGALGTTGAGNIFQGSFFDVANSIPAEMMQMVVGIYVIQVTVLLSMLINGVENGKDEVYRNNMIGKNLIVSIIVYSIALIMGVVLFGKFEIFA